MGNNIALEVSGLNKSYKEFSLKNISFSLERGTITGLVGPNGAGKTTTLKLLMKSVNKDSGLIRFNGKDIEKDKHNVYKETIGYIGDMTNFYENSKLKEIVKFYHYFYPTWDHRHFSKLITAFNLNLNQKMKELSKGTKVKFALALCFGHKPSILIMDEPTSGLDPLVRNQLLTMMHDYVKRNNATILFSSHLIEDLEKITDKLIFFNQGEIIHISSTEALIENNGSIDSFIASTFTVAKGGLYD